MKSTINRRDFLHGSLAAGSGVAGAASGISLVAVMLAGQVLRKRDFDKTLSS
jgi:hypothetical protein